MSHATNIGRYSFNHNGDFGGSVLITETNDGRVVSELLIPNEVLREFIANQIRDMKIAALERASTDELLRG